jgi:DNA-directed RNA polymerase specialized sigma24 family protein
VSGIVARQVVDSLRHPTAGRAGLRAAVSLNTTVTSFSQAGPLWQILSASDTSPSSAFGRAEQVSRLIAELGRLKADYREIIILAFFDQLPMLEIARRRGSSPKAASMLLLRAVRTLRRNMGSFSKTRPANG